MHLCICIAPDNEDERPSTSAGATVSSLPSNDPATWSHPSDVQRESIVLNGPPAIPTCFPHDSHGRSFPKSVFNKTLQNGEKACVDLLVWSHSTSKLFCFSCCLFHGTDGKQDTSKLSAPDGGIQDNWRKLYDEIKSH